MQLVVPEFFCPHIVTADARVIEHVGHRSNHSRRPRDVVDRSSEPEEITREHRMIDVSLFVRPSNGSMSSDCWNEREIWILRGQTFKLFEKRRVVRITVRIEQIQFVWQTFLGSLLEDAANRSNPDAARQKHRRPCDISMQSEGSPGTAHDELRAKSSRLQCGLKRRSFSCASRS
jgi:hypothetical protein